MQLCMGMLLVCVCLAMLWTCASDLLTDVPTPSWPKVLSVVAKIVTDVIS